MTANWYAPEDLSSNILQSLNVIVPDINQVHSSFPHQCEG